MGERYEVRRFMQPASGNRHGVWDTEAGEWIKDGTGVIMEFYGRPLAEHVAMLKNSEPKGYTA